MIVYEIFVANHVGFCRFECKLDKIVFGRNLERRCAAGGKLTTTPCSYTACDFVYGYQGNTSYSKLTDGFYEFSVRAKDIVSYFFVWYVCLIIVYYFCVTVSSY